MLINSLATWMNLCGEKGMVRAKDKDSPIFSISISVIPILTSLSGNDINNNTTIHADALLHYTLSHKKIEIHIPFN